VKHSNSKKTINDKLRKNKKEKDIAVSDLFQKTFNEYFDSYYNYNKSVKNVSYQNMANDLGYSVKLEYKNFNQYVNVYYNAYEPYTINCCFEFTNSKVDFLCHFVDVLNEIDSDDISFYTYAYCIDDETIKNAIEKYDKSVKTYREVNDIE
jgi:hypothetical protein